MKEGAVTDDAIYMIVWIEIVEKSVKFLSSFDAIYMIVWIEISLFR